MKWPIRLVRARLTAEIGREKTALQCITLYNGAHPGSQNGTYGGNKMKKLLIVLRGAALIAVASLGVARAQKKSSVVYVAAE
jgi:hypothetical protein